MVKYLIHKLNFYIDQKAEQLFKTSKLFWLVIICICASLTIVGSWTYHSTPLLEQESNTPMDTLIPNGFVLVPIDIQNYETLDSILGKYGVVDLYSLDPRINASKKPIVKGIRMIRSPKNPLHFAVLAPEEQAHLLVQTNLPFFVIIQNPNANGTNFVSSEVRVQPRKILETNP